MDDVLCGLSAFRYYRVPPIVLAAYPSISWLKFKRGGNTPVTDPLLTGPIGFPIHLLADDKTKCSGAKNIRWHLLSKQLPFGSVIEVEELDTGVTSPCMTLFTLARSMSDVHLLMAMYEFCGAFTVFQPSQEVETYLERHAAAAPFGANEGWTRVRDSLGKPTDLWKRPPLIEIEELLAFSAEVERLRGGKHFFRLAHMVSGVAASPFEVQVSILLSLPRVRGGEGLSGFLNNYEVRFSHDARQIANKARAYADIYFEGDGKYLPLAIECQGGIVHSGDAASMSDADRMLALQSMGVDVLPLTYRQITNADNFRRIARQIAKKLGRPYREKTNRMLVHERDLRRELFIDWLTLGE